MKMKKSQLIAALQADLEANGDTEHVALGIPVKVGDHYFRFDVYGDIQIVNDDANYVNGMTYLVGGEIDAATMIKFVESCQFAGKGI